MRTQINRISSTVMLVLSLVALLTVLSGYFQPPQVDEGTGAHIFQLSIVAVVPTILLFLATADWKQPLRNARRVVIPIAALVLAFGALYYLEHYWYVRHAGRRAHNHSSCLFRARSPSSSLLVPALLARASARPSCALPS